MQTNIQGIALALVLASNAASALQAGRVSTLEVQSDGTGAVRVYDDQSGALLSTAPGLAGIVLLPFEINGRTHLTEFLPGEARLGNDVPSAARGILPNGSGSLYHFRRTDGPTSVTYGFFLVTPRGGSVVVHALPGVGPAGSSSPYVPNVACSPSGDALLVATVPAAGGNILEIRPGPPAVVFDRTSNLPPRRFHPQSLALGDTWGVFTMKRALMRFDRVPGAQASAVPFGVAPGPSFVSGSVAFSRNRAFAAATAGTSGGALDAFVFGPTGSAQLASTAPAPITSAGFLPDAEDGPHLAVADDGHACAWRTEVPHHVNAVSRECWIGRVQAPPNDPPEQLSADAHFLDTLDEVGVFVFRAPTRLQVGVGAQTAPGASSLESVDLYQVDVPATVGAAQFTNLTLSSGDASLPFFAVPEITLGRSALLASTGDTWYHDDRSNGGSVSVARMDQPGATLVLPAVKELYAWEFVGDWVWMWTRSALGGQPDELHRARVDLTAPPVMIASNDSASFDRYAVRPTGAVAVIQSTLTSETLLVTDLATGTTHSITLGALAFGPTLTFTPSGRVAYSTYGPGGAPVFHAWTPGGADTVLQSSGAVDGFVLR